MVKPDTQELLKSCPQYTSNPCVLLIICVLRAVAQCCLMYCWIGLEATSSCCAQVAICLACLYVVAVLRVLERSLVSWSEGTPYHCYGNASTMLGVALS